MEVRDFGTSWRDGIAFNALIHGLRPELVDMSALQQNSSRDNLENAFDTAERHLGIPRLLDVEGICYIIMIILTIALYLCVWFFVIHSFDQK